MLTPYDVKALHNVVRVLNELFVSRQKEVEAALIGLLSNEAVIFVGPPGSCKTALFEYLGRLINCKVFTYLLTKYTEPDELFGPLDVNAYRRGEMKRVIVNTALDADIVFLDEVFKASSSIRNTLLRIMNEREYRFGNQVVRVDWLGFFAASNEVSTDSEDQAFYDRLVIRRFVRYVSPDDWRDLIRAGVMFEADGVSKRVTAVMGKDLILKLRGEVLSRLKSVLNNNALIERYLHALSLLEREGIILSDRRKVKVLKVASAYSVYYGESSVIVDDVADALRLVAVHDYDDLRRVEEVIAEARLNEGVEVLNKVRTLVTELGNIVDEVERASDMAELKDLKRRGDLIIEALKKELMRLRRSPRFTFIVNDVKEAVGDFRRAIRRKVGG